MKVVVTADGNGLDAPTNPRFGRCPTFLIVDTETMAFEAVPNPAMSASGGAGIQAAQYIVEQGAQAILTGNLGPNAAEVLQAADIPVYLNREPTAEAAVKAFQEGRLSAAPGPNVPAHAGMGRGTGMGVGRGRRRQQQVTPKPEREEEISNLKQMAADLRRQLADIVDRIEELEED
jgi:predicted Fe-Mo cluster-binding NifX family protein